MGPLLKNSRMSISSPTSSLGSPASLEGVISVETVDGLVLKTRKFHFGAPPVGEPDLEPPLMPVSAVAGLDALVASAELCLDPYARL